MSEIVNTERRGVVAGAIIGLIGLLMMLLPGLVGMDGMDGGYALAVFGLVVLILGIVTYVLYRPRARVLSLMLSGEDLLVHWTYDAAQVERQVVRDRRTQLAQNRSLLLIVAIWWVIWVAFFMVLGHAGGKRRRHAGLFIAIMLGVGAVVAAAGLGIPYLRARGAWQRRLGGTHRAARPVS